MTAAAEYQANTPKPALVLVEPVATGPASDAARPTTAASEAISALWRTHGTALMRFALKLTLGDRQRAEDIVQETMLRAWRHPEVVGDGQKAIRPWLFTVTRHVAIDMWRRGSRADEIIDDRQTDRPDPSEPIEQAMSAIDMRSALAQLTPEHRQVIVEMYYHSRSVAEIAEKLGIPSGTVKSRCYYALRQLRRVLPAESGGAPSPRPRAGGDLRAPVRAVQADQPA
jgi:RNA polymerase sigma-70 factor (ECF subfamily)